VTTELTDANGADYEAILELADHPDLDDAQRVHLAKHALSHLLKFPMIIEDIMDATDLDRARVEAVLDTIDGRITKGAATLNGVQRGAVEPTNQIQQEVKSKREP
jgi:hypothetical protein